MAEVWYHGTPDVRELRGAGAFFRRHEPRRIVPDPAAFRIAKERAREDGISALEAMERHRALEACFEFQRLPVPVFLAARRETASSYADDRRAFDYQNAEPATLEVEMDMDRADITIDAGGGSFRDLGLERIMEQLKAADGPVSPEAFRSALMDRLQCASENRIRVADLGAALWLCGARIVDVRNVRDTHDGKGRADTVRMVFDPELLRIPAFARKVADLPEP